MKKTILIVDDEDRIRRVYRQLFKRQGFNVLAAADVLDARDMLLKEDIDLVLLDINMGEINGDILYEVAQSFHKDIKVIVSSVYSLEDQKELIAGADDYYDKSDSLRILVNKVKNVLLDNSHVQKRRNILVIDDDKKVRLIFHKLLNNSGYHSSEFGDGENVLQYLRKQIEKIDLIILDLAMPKIAGEDFFEEIKTKYPDTKIIIASNYPVDTQEAFVFDADDYYDKSDGIAVFPEKVKRLIGANEECCQRKA